MPPVLRRKRAAPPEEDNIPIPPKKKVDSKQYRRKPTLFDDLDASSWIEKKRPRKEVLDSLTASDYDSGHSSSSSSDEFEDVPITRNYAEDSSNEKFKSTEFEDVPTSVTYLPPNVGPSGDLELTLTRDTRISVSNPLGAKKAPSKIEREIRISTHKCHVQSLLWHNAVRNSWLCDKELHEILLRQLPHKVTQLIKKWKQTKMVYHETTTEEIPTRKIRSSRKLESDNQNRQSTKPQVDGPVDTSGDEPLFHLLRTLMQYWRKKFKIILPGLRKIGYMSLQRLDEVLKGFNKGENNPIEYGEAFRDLEEFKERAKVLEGSRDFGAQLFTALLRAIGLKVRMVASLQPVGFGWNQNEEALYENPQANVKNKSKINKNVPESKNLKTSDDNESISKVEIKVSKVALKDKAKSKNKTRPNHSSLNQIEFSDTESTPSSSDDDSIVGSEKSSKPSARYDKDLDYPHYWTEILSPVTNTYTPIDVMVLQIIASNRELIEKFEPRSTKCEKMKQVIAYVIGHSSDGTAKDLTTRYLKGKMWPGKTRAYRYPKEKITIADLKSNTKRDICRDWFKTLISLYERGSEKFPRDIVDEHEDATDLKPMTREKKEFKVKKETLQYYKTSPEYVLERHMKREEALKPNTEHVKLFTVGKGDSAQQEKVFLRKDVVMCKSIESWHKEGRIPKPGEQPLKNVPYRAATKLRKRKLIEAEQALGEKLLQGLYSVDQTELIIPAPIQNGIIPKNEFGNVDLFVDTMLPKGAVHLVQRGVPKICRRLNIDFASAVTGFEFGNRMAVPIITGVLVAEEYQDTIIQEWLKDEEIRVEREEMKRKKAALNMWKKLLVCQRVIKRCKNEYGNNDDTTDISNSYQNKNINISTDRSQEEDEVNQESPLADDNDESEGDSDSS
ncbi:DNA repair protein rhp41 [Golovinomyces cichoracearum]|uniref:DNA repair protein rhp41 n=1 Tax=Golovinomyces cichoracearum TaxID=62708 RepID=A0A420IRA9_9PEZI|nr:DNA repair protein rhp41 [Golovinomyces cichoracearum]